ncbi:MAG: sugar phosphate nucleotidyltransferase [Candidatus Muiribacteriaceae bacterium]
MKAVIMAGGFGTRLRPVTNRVPKPVTPVVNIPMMEHIVHTLKDMGITEVVSVLYHQPDIITDHFGDGSDFGIKMEYVTTADNYGTAGSVRMAADILNERFILLSGDVLTDFDLNKAIKWHEEKKSKATILLTRVDNPLAFGIVITDDDGKITRFLEKPSWGQVFSDTINTGIYIFEPEVLDYIPERQDFDFSKDFFPKLMEEKVDIFGYIARGYWMDVGDIKAYRKANMDVIMGEVKAHIAGKRIDVVGRDIWLGENTKLPKDYQFEGGVLVGGNCRIGRNVFIKNSVIGPNCVIGDDARINESVVWENCHIGREAMLDKNIVCSGSKIMDEAYIGEEAVIGENCTVGEGATVKPGVKMWPGKVIEDGAVLGASLVWGERWSRELFNTHGIVGIANHEITPEFATKVGAAMGAAMGKGAVVATGRDGHDVSRLINRAFISGLLSVGVNVQDLRNIPLAVMRYQIKERNVIGGIHTHMSPYDNKLLDIKFVDDEGMDFTVAKQKAIERNFFREDFPRAEANEVGNLTFPHRVLDYYKEGLIRFVDVEAISKANLKVVLDYSFGSASNVFPSILSEFNCDIIALNSFEDSKRITRTKEQFDKDYQRLGNIVRSLNADLGVMMDSGAEKIFLVDENGDTISNEDAQAFIINVICQARKKSTIGVPVNTSTRIERLVKKSGCEIVYTKLYNRNMMQTADVPGVKLVADGEGGFMFPEFMPWFDAMASISIILNLIADKKLRFSDLKKNVGSDNRVKFSVPCAWAEKGTVMRNIMDSCRDEELVLIDGVKIMFSEDEWVLLIPDSEKPFFNIFAEAKTEAKSRELAEKYRDMVVKWKK